MTGISGISGSFQNPYQNIFSRGNALSAVVGHAKAQDGSAGTISSSVSYTGGAAASYMGDTGSFVSEEKYRQSSVKHKHTSSGATVRQSEQFRRLLRDLKKTEEENKNPYAVKPDGKNDGFTELLGVTDDEEDKERSEKPVVYNYKEVASKIQRAKTSVSAAQAVFAAKRKVMDVKRKISAGDGDPEELQLALTHAKRMEMAARKKKNHLELEEIASAKVKGNEREDRQEDVLNKLKNAMVEEKEEKVSGLEDKVFEERQDMIKEAAENYGSVYEAGEETASLVNHGQEAVSSAGQDVLAGLNEMISEFGEEELKALEDMMEMLEDMEMTDPHMDREDLDEMKMKHRLKEQKAMVKADMEYLKGVMEHREKSGQSVDLKAASGKMTVSGGVSVSSGVASAALSVGRFSAGTDGLTGWAGAPAAASSAAITEGISVDVSV